MEVGQRWQDPVQPVEEEPVVAYQETDDEASDDPADGGIPLDDAAILRFQYSLADKVGDEFFELAATGLSFLTGAALVVIGTLAKDRRTVIPMVMSGPGGTLRSRPYLLPEGVFESMTSGDEPWIFIGDVASHPSTVVDERLEIHATTGYVACLIRDASGSPIGVIEGLFRGATPPQRELTSAFLGLATRTQLEMHRLKLEHSLLEQSERYEFALRAGGFGVYDWNADTGEAIMDERYFEILGIAPFEGDNAHEIWLSRIHPDDRSHLIVNLDDKPGEEKRYHGPVRLRFRTDEGHYKWIQYESYSFRDKRRGGARRSIGMIKDVDAEVRREQELNAIAQQKEELHRQVKEREERYAFALKVGRLGVYDWYPKEGRTVFSPLMAEMMGRKVEEFNKSYESWLRTVHPDDHEEVDLKSYLPAILDGTAQPKVYRTKMASGEYRWMESHHIAVDRDEEGNLTRIIGIVRDIHAAKMASDMLSDALRQQQSLNLELAKREQALTDAHARMISQMTQLKKLNRELRESEARWAYALEGNGDGVVEWNIETNEVFFSDRAKEILKFSLNQENQSQYLLNIHPNARDEFYHLFQLSLRPPFEPFQMEVPLVDEKSNARWVMFRGKVVEHDEDRPRKLVGTVTDLSQLKLFQKEFTIYEQMIKQSQNIVLFTTLDGTVEFVNSTTVRMLEYRPHALIGRNISMLLDGVTVDRIADNTFGDHLSFFTKSGKRIIAEVTSSLIRYDGADIGYVINAIDITEKHALEEKVKTLTLTKFKTKLEGQRKRTAMVIEVQENEKERIARELHDGAGQLLSLAKLQIEEMEVSTGGVDRAGLVKLKEVIQHISSDLKGLTRELMPLSIRRLGLESALRELVQRYRDVRDGKVEVFCKIHLDGYNPDQKTAIHIYRMAQEAVNNSIKHSGATSMSLMCMKLKNSVNLIVEDNGKGFHVKGEQGRVNGFGLKTMKERARLINGRLRINSRPGRGTTISLTIPLVSND